MLTELLTFLAHPFIQRALIGGVLVGLLTSWIGIFAVLKRSSMVGDTVAHASLAGVALGLLFQWNPVISAAIFAIFIALILPKIQKASRLPVDSILGFILPSAMALGVILLSIIPGYQPELISFLFGSILAISWSDIIVISIVTFVVMFMMLSLHEKMVFVSFDEMYARTAGIKVELMNALFSVALALTIVIGIQLVGIVLLNALLVIPASTVRLYSRSLKHMFVFTPVVSTLVIISGVVASFFINIPTGPTIAVISGGTFVLAIIVKQLLKR